LAFIVSIGIRRRLKVAYENALTRA
jgi:hypothetical protein